MSQSKAKQPKEKQAFSAVTMRIVLVVVLLLILALMSGGFYVAYSSLRTTAEEVAKTQSEAQVSDARVQNLISLERQLKQHTYAIDRAKQIVAESKSYQYQNQIITDLTHYATQAGVSITSFTFEGDAPVASSGAAQTTTPATEGATDDATQSATPTGNFKSTQVSIQLGETVSYQNLLHFLYLIEQNLTRMQVAAVSMTKGEAADAVTAQTLNLEVYIR